MPRFWTPGDENVLGAEVSESWYVTQLRETRSRLITEYTTLLRERPPNWVSETGNRIATIREIDKQLDTAAGHGFAITDFQGIENRIAKTFGLPPPATDPVPRVIGGSVTGDTWGEITALGDATRRFYNYATGEIRSLPWPETQIMPLPKPGKTTVTVKPEKPTEHDLYEEVTGRKVSPNATYETWKAEYEATGQSYPFEQMLARVMPDTYSKSLDGEKPVTKPVKESRSGEFGPWDFFGMSGVALMLAMIGWLVATGPFAVAIPFLVLGFVMFFTGATKA